MANAELEGRGICLDLDSTLGFFLNKGHEAEGIRDGMRDTLERLYNEGGRHFITTSGDGERAQRIIQQAGLAPYFVEVLPGGEIDAGRGKNYRPVARRMGFSDEEAARKMIVTGDTTWDQPADISGLVFIHHPDGHMYSGNVLENIIRRLVAEGTGDFNKGFHALYANGIEHKSKTQGIPSGRYFTIPEGIKLALTLINPHEGGILPRFNPKIIIPYVRVLQAPLYYRQQPSL